MCTKYHGHTYYYQQAAMLETVFYSLRLFVVGGERIAMAMVVVGHISTQNIIALMLWLPFKLLLFVIHLLVIGYIN